MKDILFEEWTSVACKNALGVFWENALEIRETDTSLILAMPVLMPDGWQTIVHLDNMGEGFVRLSDHGKIFSWLETQGLNVSSRSVSDQIRSKMLMFDAKRENNEICKYLKFPFAIKEVQLFTELLASIAHLINRLEVQSFESHAAYSRIYDIVKSIGMEPLENKKFKTPYREIRVDIAVRGEECQTVFKAFDQKHRQADSMEMWSYRMKEIVDFSDVSINSALVYNEDLFQPDEQLLQLTRSNCGLVCPSHRTDEIRDFLKNVI